MVVASASDASSNDLLDNTQWAELHSETLDSSVDNASIYRTAQNTADIVQLFIIADFFLALILGCILCSIFSRFFGGVFK